MRGKISWIVLVLLAQGWSAAARGPEPRPNPMQWAEAARGTLRLVNRGGAALVLSELSPDAPFSLGGGRRLPARLDPGTSVELGIGLEPSGAGVERAVLRVVSDDPETPPPRGPHAGRGPAGTAFRKGLGPVLAGRARREEYLLRTPTHVAGLPPGRRPATGEPLSASLW